MIFYLLQTPTSQHTSWRGLFVQFPITQKIIFNKLVTENVWWCWLTIISTFCWQTTVQVFHSAIVQAWTLLDFLTYLWPDSLTACVLSIFFFRRQVLSPNIELLPWGLLVITKEALTVSRIHPPSFHQWWTEHQQKSGWLPAGQPTAADTWTPLLPHQSAFRAQLSALLLPLHPAYINNAFPSQQQIHLLMRYLGI